MDDLNGGGPRSLSIFGSTGSIGRQALEVVRASAGRFTVHALSANSSLEDLALQIAEFRPPVAVVGTSEMASELCERFPWLSCRVGRSGLYEVAGEAEIALNAVVGFSGLSVTLGALEAGKRLALANKESLVAAGPVVHAAMEASKGEIVPVDSEHAAIHQCLRGYPHTEVARLLLTSSGGPFRERAEADLASVTKDEALKHPTWSMGPKITVDSSTLMNKALEIIEAVELFGVEPAKVEVVVHPESIVHSMVEYVDGAVLAQLSRPDMRLAIGYALGYPERMPTKYGELDFTSRLSLHFEPPRRSVFKGIDLAFEALRAGAGAPAWLNAANEVAVDAFLQGRIRWIEIYEVIEATMERFEPTRFSSADEVIALDQIARLRCSEVIGRRAPA
ncbi:MAG: 1-deoxy-D-xylulose-5-phosphate reductoisomerase [Actinomycetota bacterium]|nr:1-deoxy-D-xylulose-5-phosphate reductoisomerase [Actinomycetota bacterium]